ncbi:hypothetical protein BJY24_001460 [Nocardia transvalensis]|uniref:Uncharacterized protein n=1 Tax=Nocardia transvalensis TaxID=37333 RepID=A0A7W9PBF8_9NOCA|nr:hypothetical protein [Nocardia transvalensis]MBB5912593.1 hypothetical protein [Nocardia transvalensis]
MSFAEPSAAQPESPLPHEPDVLIRVHISLLREQELRFVACESAARWFAEYWIAYYRPDTVTFEPPDPTCPRLPCERLWTLP